MAYKDKDKQREANRERQKRRRDKIKTEGVTKSRRDTKGVTGFEGVGEEYLESYIEPCMRPGYVCPIPEDQRKPDINYGPYMTALELEAAGLKANRVSKPGDVDYQSTTSVRPNDKPIRPAGVSDKQWAYIQFKAGLQNEYA